MDQRIELQYDEICERRRTYAEWNASRQKLLNKFFEVDPKFGKEISVVINYSRPDIFYEF